MPAKKVKVAVSFAVVAVLMVWLTISGFNENMQYYVTINDVQAMDATEAAKGLRVKGNLVAGSVEETPNSLEIFFLIEENGQQMRVRYDKERPDTFKDGSEVLVEGKYLVDEGYFDANMLMAKCPSKYEGEDYSDHEAAVGEGDAYYDQGGTN